MSTHGNFVWYELMTPDVKAAEKFYTSVIGWDARDAGMPNMAYTLFSAPSGTLAAGLLEMPQRVLDAGAPPFWTGYVFVDDVDASAAKAKELGGTIHHDPDDIPGVGRFAVIGDPQGATIAMYRTMMMPGGGALPGTPGMAGWRELYADDIEAAFGFYAKLFGWTKAEHHDMGPMGIYQLFAVGGQTVGGMMSKPPGVPAPCWLYYFNVDGLDAAVARVQAGGGRILSGPMPVPGGSFVAQCLDPQGAAFCLVATRR